MSDKEMELSSWLSTYGVLTAKRLLETFHVKLEPKDLSICINNSKGIFFDLIQVPLKNVFNGIILQQTNDFQIYGQKLFVDYLLTGESDKSPDLPGARVRETIESERLNMVALDERFRELERTHALLIAKSQNDLIAIARELIIALQGATDTMKSILQKSGVRDKDKSITQALHKALIIFDASSSESNSLDVVFCKKMAELFSLPLDKNQQDFLAIYSRIYETHKKIKHVLSFYGSRTKELRQDLRMHRDEFHQLIVRVKSLFQSLPQNQEVLEKDEENQASLAFDSQIGEK